MRRICFTLMIFLCSRFLQSQAFTNGSIFNYQVGDTLIEQYQDLPPKPPTYIFRAITGKTVNTSPAATIYEEHRITNRLYYDSYYVINTDITNTIVTFQVTNYTYSPLSVPWATNSLCLVQADTNYVGSCGQYVHERWWKQLPPPNQCFEPPSRKLTYIEGAGIYEYTVSLNSYPTPGMGFETTLLYLHKVGQPACGNKTEIKTGIHEPSIGKGYSIFPKPFGSRFTISIDEAATVRVNDLTGKSLLAVEGAAGKNTLDLSECQDGVYLVEIKTARGSWVEKVIKKEEQ